MKTRGPKKPSTNAELSAATMKALLRDARRELARHGYRDASVDRIAEAARMTKGAVYYHFGSKEGLFEAVLRDVQKEIVRRIEARAVAAKDPVAAVVAGCEAFIDVVLDPALRRIALVDGPNVVGWAKWRAIDGELGLGSLKEGLRACKAQGALRADADVDVLAHLVSGALNEAVFMIAEADDPAEAHARVTRSMSRLLRAVLGRPSHRRR